MTDSSSGTKSKAANNNYQPESINAKKIKIIMPSRYTFENICKPLSPLIDSDTVPTKLDSQAMGK